jgi:hypothetical protein
LQLQRELEKAVVLWSKKEFSCKNHEATFKAANEKDTGLLDKEAVPKLIES